MSCSVLFAFLALCTVAYSDDRAANNLFNPEGDPDLAAYLREAVENFRVQMGKGIPLLKLPVLDPLHLKDLDLHVEEKMASVNLKIKELTVKHLSHFKIIDLQPNLEEFYLHLNLSLSNIYAGGHYNLSGKFVKVFPIYGEGHFDINATDIYIAGTGKLDLFEDTVQMSMFQLDLHWEQLLLDFENFLGGGSFSEVLQRLVPGVGKDVFLAYKPMILEKLESALRKTINEKLNEPEVIKIVKEIFVRNSFH